MEPRVSSPRHRSSVARRALRLSLLSLAGIPPLAGFVGKLALFVTTIEPGYAWLVLVLVLVLLRRAIEDRLRPVDVEQALAVSRRTDWMAECHYWFRAPRPSSRFAARH